MILSIIFYHNINLHQPLLAAERYTEPNFFTHISGLSLDNNVDVILCDQC